MPFTFGLKEVDGKSSGFVLRVPVTFRVTDIDLGAIEFEDLKAFMVVPRLEAHIPVTRIWTIKPFVGLGAAWEIDLDKGVWLAQAGVQGEGLWDQYPWEYFWGSRVAYNLSVGWNERNYQDIGSVDSRIEARYRTGGNVSGRHWQPGVYGQVFYYWDGPKFEEGVTTLILDLEYEVGLSIATLPRWKVLGFGVPRVSVGYRFGDGLRGLRIGFGEY